MNRKYGLFSQFNRTVSTDGRMDVNAWVLDDLIKKIGSVFRDNKKRQARAMSDSIISRVCHAGVCVCVCVSVRAMLCCYHISRHLSYAHLWWNYVNSFGTRVFISLQHIIWWNNSYRLRVCNARWIQFNAWRAVIISTFYFTLVGKLVAVAIGWRISLI